MTTFTVTYTEVNERDADHAKSAARRKLLGETNAVVQYKHMTETAVDANGDGTFEVKIEFSPNEQVVEHDAQWWLENFSVSGTIDEGALAG